MHYFVNVHHLLYYEESILFASKHNIQISIFSTGHSFSGRNTANNSLMINLSKMKNYYIYVTDNDNEIDYITVETGLF